MSETFEELYASLLKEVFTIHARQQLEQGADGLVSARTYAEQGKPEFTLAFLLLIDSPEEEKHELLAYAYERRARISQEKAAQLDAQFHRPFPLIKLEAQKDLIAAHAIRQGRPVQVTKVPPVS